MSSSYVEANTSEECCMKLGIWRTLLLLVLRITRKIKWVGMAMSVCYDNEDT